MASRKLTIIGSGNVGYQLSMALHQKGFGIRQVFSRDIHKAAEIAKAINAIAVDKWEDIDTQSDVYICCLADNALHEASVHLKLPGKVVLHTAGSVSLDVLKPISEHIGVLYPLQTISRQRKTDWAALPILTEASDTIASEVVNTLAKALSQQVHTVDYNQRRTIHLAAVFANNFPNHLWTIAQQLCSEGNVSFDWLKPLISETVIKAMELSPAMAQTGPAKRNDTVTIQDHIDLLKQHPEHPKHTLWQKIYNDISESIKST